MNRTTVILLGGFLGAGKTSLMARAAEHLTRRGKKVGLVTNDQAADMVDTRFLEQRGFAVREVSGSCFCCNFDGLIAALDSLREAGAQIVLAEAVGSCTDLSATILQPLKDKLRVRYDVRPASVLVDPARLAEVEPELAALAASTLKSADLHPSAAYIIEKQMEEADLLILNKTDTLSAAERDAALALLAKRHPRARTLAMSVVEETGVREWLDVTLSDEGAVRPGNHIVSVDYDVYAEGEALLGWLNASVLLRAEKGSAPWRQVCADLVEALAAEMREKRLYSGHVKALVRDAAGRGGAALANLPRTGEQPRVQGEVPPDCRETELLLNARVAMSPESLEALVRAQLETVRGRYGLRAEVRSLKSLRPGRPRPTWRYERVV